MFTFRPLIKKWKLKKTRALMAKELRSRICNLKGQFSALANCPTQKHDKIFIESLVKKLDLLPGDCEFKTFNTWSDHCTISPVASVNQQDIRLDLVRKVNRIAAWIYDNNRCTSVKPLA